MAEFLGALLIGWWLFWAMALIISLILVFKFLMGALGTWVIIFPIILLLIVVAVFIKLHKEIKDVRGGSKSA